MTAETFIRMNPDSAILTIAIPTYNRAARLQAQIERLLPQLGPEVRLCVYDNASPDGTREVVSKYRSQGVCFFRAANNGGAGRNIFRCFEECQTEWLWILSDDDPIASGAVADLLQLIKHCHADFIHTSSPLCQHDAQIIVGDVSQLLKQASLASLLWISTVVYRIPSFRSLFWLYAESISTWGPQLVVLLAVLERQEGKGLASSTRLIIEPPGEPRWSTLDFIARFSHVPEYLQTSRHQTLVAGHIWEYYYWALLGGLRELDNPAAIRRWQRIRKSARQNFRAYGAISPIWDVILKKWYRAGSRKTSLTVVHQALLVTILAWCPSSLFFPVLKLLPKPAWVCRLLRRERNETAADIDETCQSLRT